MGRKFCVYVILIISYLLLETTFQCKNISIAPTAIVNKQDLVEIDAIILT